MNEIKKFAKRLVDPYIPAIFSRNYEATVEGWLGRLIGALERPVVMYLIGESETDNYIKVPDVSRDYSTIAPLCGCLRKIICFDGDTTCTWEEERCKKHDTKAAKKIIHLCNGINDDSSLIMEEMSYEYVDGSIKKYYTYICPDTSLMEWGIPIELYGEPIGVFLTGQIIIDEERTRERLMEHSSLINDQIEREKFINRIKQPLGNNNPSNEQKNKFFERIHEIEISLLKDHKQVCDVCTTEIENHILKCINGQMNIETVNQDNTYDDKKPFGKVAKTIEDYNLRFKLVRSGLYQGIWESLIERIKLSEVTVFKPRSDVNKLGEMKKIDGSRIRENINEQITCEFRRFDIDLKTCKYSIDLQSKAWNIGIMRADVDRYFCEFCLVGESEISPILIGDKPDNLNKSSLHICAIRGMEHFAVAYLLQYIDEETMQAQIDYMQSILRTVSSLYLALWNAVYADWQRFRTDMVSKFVSHELAQIMMSLESHSKQFLDVHSSALAEIFRNRENFKSKFPGMDNLVVESQHFITDTQRAEKMISGTAKCIDLIDPFAELTYHYFMPYETILYNWIDVIAHRCEFDYKKIEHPWVSISDTNRPMMYADNERMEQVVYNLLNNARKYGYAGTKIILNCQLSKDGKNYEIIVTSFGIQIHDEDKIYVMGVRGADADAITKSGSGFGLHVVKNIIEKHNGCITHSSKLVSNYNVPLLKMYIYNNFKGRSNVIATKCEEEYQHLREIGIYESILGKKIPFNEGTEYDLSVRWMTKHSDIPGARHITITPSLLSRSIEWKTYKNTFTCSIPYIQKED